MNAEPTPSGPEGSSGKFIHSCADRTRFGAGCFNWICSGVVKR